MDILNNVQQTSLVSVVMPAYNAEKTIAGAVLSLKSQTYSNWELIIVDDKSTDATIEVVEKLSQLDSRIRLIKRTENSGGCRIPRFEAVLAALGDYICYLDADDVLEATYIEKVIERIKETGADVVLTRLVLRRDGNNFASIPEESFDMQRLVSGEDACRMTLGKWEISVSGALSTSLYYKSFVEAALTNSSPLCFMDEVDYRKFLYYAKKVAFSDAIYYYEQYDTSIVHNVGKLSHRLFSQKELFNFVKSSFYQYNAVILDVYMDSIEVMYRAGCRVMYNKKNIENELYENIRKSLKSYYSWLCSQKLPVKGLKYSLLMSSYTIFLFICYMQCVRCMIKEKYL
ncbi:MAG: glycosyltransferase family 2 protein [Akkermansia sp.]|nr:glycosyltransferase family 2 protein [Akkermansia sp.]